MKNDSQMDSEKTERIADNKNEKPFDEPNAFNPDQSKNNIETPDKWGYGVCSECDEFDMCPECKAKDDAFLNEMMHECFQAEIAFREDQKKISDRILKALLAVKGSAWVSQLIEYAKEQECHDPFKIVRKPKGKVQESDFEFFGKEWVDQYTGYECDDYYGTISIQIDEKRWLEMPFHC